MKIENYRPAMLWKLKITDFIKANWLLITILLIGSFLRLYKISAYMTFLGDEGRDVLVVRNLLVHFDPILIGPGTSVGDMYLGPLYYYFMAPFLFLSNFSPVGPAVGVALLGIATIYLVYVTGHDWFGKKAGLIASLFFAISPTVIIYSRSSWNPNIMPFFALLSIFSIWKVWKEKNYKYLIYSAISFAFVLNSHYLGVLLLPVLFIYWFLSRPPIRYTLYAIALFLFLMSPILIFDLRHDFMNFNALINFLNSNGNNLGFSLSGFITKIYGTFEIIINSLLISKNLQFGRYVSLGIMLFLVFVLTKKKFNILLLWLGFGIIGFGLYNLSIYDHYLGFLFAAPFLLIGGFIENIFENLSKAGNYVLLLAILLLFIVNVINNPLRNSPNNQMKRAENVANKIIAESKDQYFNIAVVAEQNYEDGYQYFLEKNNSKIIEIDAQLPETVADQLFVICEKVKEKCDPTHSSKAEVANFGWSIISEQWTVDGVQLYKLIHTK